MHRALCVLLLLLASRLNILAKPPIPFPHFSHMESTPTLSLIPSLSVKHCTRSCLLHTSFPTMFAASSLLLGLTKPNSYSSTHCPPVQQRRDTPDQSTPLANPRTVRSLSFEHSPASSVSRPLTNLCPLPLVNSKPFTCLKSRAASGSSHIRSFLGSDYFFYAFYTSLLHIRHMPIALPNHRHSFRTW